MVFHNYIDGEWVASTHAIENRSPSDIADVIGEYAEADAGQVEQAVAAAQAAFPAWSRTTAAYRAEILLIVARELEARKEELGEQLSREEGKIRQDGVNEIQKAAKVFEYFAAEAMRPDGEHFPQARDGIEAQALREPIGVIGILSPWNLPLGTPSWKIAPALAFGNTVVFKPSNIVPASAWALAEIISRAGVPAGTFNLVMGRGCIAGEALIQSPNIAAITFTGSDSTGGHIAEVTGRRRVKLQMEMGGKNPLIVLDDANLKTASRCAFQGAFLATGQRCTASSRLIVTKGIHDRFVDALVDHIKSAIVDHALKPSSEIGPVVSDQQLQQDLHYVALGVEEGARLVCGGERLNRDKSGHYLSPALFVDSSNFMRLNREEIFGPIAAVIRVDDYEEALHVANDTPYGLASGICTSSMKYASHFMRNAESGICMINMPTASADFHAPFGGRKASSHGSRELSTHAREFYTTVKTVYASHE